LNRKEGLRTSHTHTRIGPSPEQRKQRQEEALQHQTKRAVEKARQRQATLQEFKTKYGEHLADISVAYFKSIGANSEGIVDFNHKMVRTETIQPVFTNTLVRNLKEQPEGQEVMWLSQFLRDLLKVL